MVSEPTCEGKESGQQSENNQLDIFSFWRNIGLSIGN